MKPLNDIYAEPVDNITESYRCVYTSDATFTVNNRCTARFGPLAHAFRSGGDTTMDHRILEGQYCIYRINYMDQPTAEKRQFTVISIREVDPVKIVKFVKCVSPVQDASLSKNYVFDDQRWMQLVGEDAAFNDKTPSKNKIMLASYGSHQGLKTTQFSACIMPPEELHNCNTNTFYVRLLTKQLSGSLCIRIHAPKHSEFTVTVGKSTTPAAVGISHCASSTDMRGYVLYTSTDLRGRLLPGSGKAFAVILGPKYNAAGEHSFISPGIALNVRDFLCTGRRTLKRNYGRCTFKRKWMVLVRYKVSPITEPADMTTTIQTDGSSHKESSDEANKLLPSTDSPVWEGFDTTASEPTNEIAILDRFTNYNLLPTEEELFDTYDTECRAWTEASHRTEAIKAWLLSS